MSTLTNEVGVSPLLFDIGYSGALDPAYAAPLVLDATGELAAFVGFVWHPTVKTGTINIRKVHFRCGAVAVTWLTTVFRVSLQDVSATAGPPYQPDATQDQTFDFNNGAQLTANAWNSTGNLSADRAVDLSVYGPGTANSRLLAVVFEYNAFTALDSVVISTITNTDTNPFALIAAQPLLNTGAWTIQGGVGAVVALECDDGTFAFIRQAMPYSAIGSATTANNAAFRAIGIKFKVPTQRKIDTIGLSFRIPNGADGDMILYDSDGTTALRTVPIDNDPVRAASSQSYAVAMVEPVTLTADTYYRLVIVPSTATAITVIHVDVNAAGLMDGLLLGQNAHYTTRDSGGSWTDTTTRRPFFALGFSAFHDGAASGGGLKIAGTGGLAG